ncbi:MAG: outer membrane beta-barrel protein [Gammaproteobacteria bacterium]|nr:outer membrane beta-barrel protein [Gammaproteobacteria bacterium]MCW5582739.1 outer membrane beta-barrel protein [Gammaproteobacteria bacterium]
MELKSPFKLSLIFLLATAPTSIALAKAYDLTPCSFSGFTVGLGLGATTLMTDITSHANLASETPSFDVLPPPPGLYHLATPTSGNSVSNYSKGNIYRYGAMAKLFVGYGNVFDNHAYLGAELGVNFFGANDATLRNTAAHNTTVSSTDSQLPAYGEAQLNTALSSRTKITRNAVEPLLDLKLGFLMTPTALAYIRGGINYNTIRVKTNSSYQADGAVENTLDPEEPNFPLTATASSSFENSRKKSSVGYRAGIGMEVMITPEFGVGADYVYTFYRNVNTNTANHAGNDVACDAYEGCQVVAADQSNSTRTRLSDQQVLAQLIYHFG